MKVKVGYAKALGQSRDKELNKVFRADLVGALNILRKGAKLLRLGLYEALKTLFLKLRNPVRIKLMELFFKVIPPAGLLSDE